ncbi:LysR substrate-binding domain-containing protein [Bacillus massilinigeriensis]|uniref:LysR substrate-binding domain-containing protein n=1 Tax=Bacillus massilionigeriensis TaxID=1805475 RepID=UPI00096AED5C|nr:LysR substrate-binding domain-containing protein [Bacillus massilionigeriensis]
MELRQIEYFIEVAKREHVTEAAHNLHIAQSAISRQIVNLEAELGVDLFIRDGRNVKLTPIGSRFLEHMEEAMQVIKNAKREVVEFLDPLKGTIRIGFSSSLAVYMLPTVLSAFRKEYPDVKILLSQQSYRLLIDSVSSGEIDLALLGPVPSHEKKVEGEALFLEKLVALLPSSHPLATSSALHLRDLQNESFVLFRKGFVLHKMVVNACQMVGFTPKVSFEGDDIDAIKGLVSAGLGVTVIPEITLIDSLPRLTVQVPIVEPEITRSVGYIISNQRNILPTIKLFLDFCKDFFQVLEKYS